MRLFYLLVIYFSINTYCIGQFTVAVNVGKGYYSMEQMKQYANHLKTANGVNAQITSNYPAYYNYEVIARWINDKNTIAGLSYNYGSTGARVTYSDYSGSLNYDLSLIYNNYSVLLGRQIKLSSKYSIGAEIQTGFRFSKYTNSFSIDLKDSHIFSNLTSTLNSVNYFMQPTLTINGKWGRVGANLFLGYNTEIAKGKFKPYHEIEPDVNKLTADWSGVRVGGGLSFAINNEVIKSEDNLDKLSVSFGIGLDHGGIGFNVLYHPVQNIGFFGGLGIAFIKPGFNIGTKIKLKSEMKYKPSLLAMYGYDAVIIVKNKPAWNKIFYGPMVGISFEQSLRSSRKGYFNYSLIVPLDRGEAYSYIDDLKSKGVVFYNVLLPFAISASYKIPGW